MKRTALLLLLLAGCAMTKRPEATQLPAEPTSDDATLLQSYEARQAELFGQLEHPQAEARPPECEKVCALVANICELSGRICTITSRHDGDDSMSHACSDAADRCNRAQVRGSSCSCGAQR